MTQELRNSYAIVQLCSTVAQLLRNSCASKPWKTRGSAWQPIPYGNYCVAFRELLRNYCVSSRDPFYSDPNTPPINNPLGSWLTQQPSLSTQLDDAQNRRKRTSTHEWAHECSHEWVHEWPHESAHESPHEPTRADFPVFIWKTKSTVKLYGWLAF